MALRLSTGFRQKLLGTDDFQAIFAGSFINVYSGSRPATADEAIGSSILLATIYSDGNSAGLSFGTPADGEIEKTSATWSGTAVATGNAGWYRLYEATDTPATASTTNARIDGSIAISGGDLNISSTSVEQGAVQTISTFKIIYPAS